jgi:hypothetical protein
MSVMSEPLVPNPSRLEDKIVVGKFKEYKLPCSGQIPADLIQAGGEILLSAIYRLINFIWNKDALPDQWKYSIMVPIHKKSDCQSKPRLYSLLTRDDMCRSENFLKR